MSVPTPTPEQVSAEQVRRALDLLKYPYEAIEPMSPPYPDVRVTTPSGRIAVEATEVHWGVGSRGGSPTRQKEEAAIRAGVVRTFGAGTDPIPGIVRAIESKCGKRYSVDGDDLWLLLVGGSPAAPGSTFVFPPFLDLKRLAALTHERLARSGFSRCYLFCELAVPDPALYGWDRDSSWQQIVPASTGSGSARPSARRALICPECGRDGAASAFVGQGPFERAIRHEECPSGHAWHVKEGFGTESGPIECSCPDDWLTVPAGFGMRFSGLEHDAEMDAFRWRLGGRIVRRMGDAVVLDVRVVEDAGGTRTMAVVGGQYEIAAEKVIEIRSRRRH